MPLERQTNCTAVAAAAQPPGQGKLFFVSCVVASGVAQTVLGCLVQTRDWQTREGLARSHQEGFGAPHVRFEQQLGAGFAQ